jgi:hypothetical protein
MSEPVAPGTIARGLLRSLDRAALATLMRPDTPDAGSPYTSLVLVAVDHDASPLLLISTLADHTKNLAANPAVSLLFDGTVGLDEPLPRPTMSGSRHVSWRVTRVPRCMPGSRISPSGA